MNFSDYIVTSLENGHQVEVVYTDFTNAFDFLCHRVLYQKLKNFGFSGMLQYWLVSYLIKRSQYVKVRITTPTAIKCSSGFPQGSDLGPMLLLTMTEELGIFY